VDNRDDPLTPEYQAWVRALQRREPEAWTRLQQHALDAVFSFAFLRCGRREDAEDVTAEVFAAALASIQGFRGEARIVTWLIGIARRKLIDVARRRGRRPEVLEADLGEADPLGEATASENPQEAWERREQTERVRALVLQLPELQREALWLHCVDQLSLAETAQILDRTENAVKGLIHRARVTLRERLAKGEALAAALETNLHVEPTLSAVRAAPASGQ
jgi:RNA polymerase sigma-70 factor (ECF subfamily)